MNLDSTHIAIRERGFPEIMDLALHVTRAHAGPLLLALVIGAAPWLLLNRLLLGGALEDLSSDTGFGYVFVLVMLVALQTPFATALVTLYLGQATFSNRIDARRVFSDFLRSLPQLIVMQGLGRCLTAVLVISLVMPYVLWPYLNELILLERNPMFSRRAKPGAPRAKSTQKRSKDMHRNTGGDLFGRWILSSLTGAALVTVLTGGVHTLAGQFFGVQLSTRANLLYTLPICLWVVVGFFAVVRFLSYLDLRIRREGWEVELTMRAEGARLARLT